MKPEWKEFLVDAGAEFNGDLVAHYGAPERERQIVTTGNVFADLSHVGLISVHGKDAADFLQGQLSNDITAVDDGHSQLSGLCNAKGRLFALFRVYRWNDGFYLALPREHLEAALQRLRMFVLRARVTLEDASESFIRLGVSGPHADRELEEAVGAVPAEVDGATDRHGLLAVRIPGPHPRFELLGELEAMKRVWDRLNVRCAPVGADPWGLLDIAAGIPSIRPDTAEQFVPQMVNLDLTGGVSFRKGCYPGQEVVARMHYLGRLKRRMYRFHLDSDEPPEPAAAIHDAAGTAQGAVGQVVDARPHPDGGHDLLAVVQIDAADSSALRLGGRRGPSLTRAPLPYAIDAPDAAGAG